MSGEAICQMVHSSLGTLLLSNWCQKGLGGRGGRNACNTGHFSKFSSRSKWSRTASQRSLGGPREAPGSVGCATCRARSVETGLLPSPIHLGQLMVLEGPAVTVVTACDPIGNRWPGLRRQGAPGTVGSGHPAPSDRAGQGRNGKGPCLRSCPLSA